VSWKGPKTLEITPQDVQQKRFDRAKRGFDSQQVGMFLDQIATALAARDRELHEARTEIEALGREVADVKQNEEAFRLTMMAATEAKEEMLRRAAEEAARIEDEARTASQLMIERARDSEDQVAVLSREIENLTADKQRLEADIAEVQTTAQAAQYSLEDMTAHSEEDTTAGREAGRPPLELVVDQEQPVEGDPSELAARVGDLRG